MCPNVKLDWIRKHYDSDSVKKIQEMISARFKILYSSPSESSPPEDNRESKASHSFVFEVYTVLIQSLVQPLNRWLQTLQPANFESAPSLEIDSIDNYLDTGIESIAPYDGLLSYWSAMLDIKPRVARMALNYLTAPGKFMSFQINLP
jgi:hypothetical protein